MSQGSVWMRPAAAPRSQRVGARRTRSASDRGVAAASDRMALRRFTLLAKRLPEEAVDLGRAARQLLVVHRHRLEPRQGLDRGGQPAGGGAVSAISCSRIKHRSSATPGEAELGLDCSRASASIQDAVRYLSGAITMIIWRPSSLGISTSDNGSFPKRSTHSNVL